MQAEKEAKKEAKKAAKAAAKLEEQKQNGKVTETVNKLQGFMNEQGAQNKEIALKSLDVMKQAEAKADADNNKEQVKAQAKIMENVKEAKEATDFKAKKIDQKAKE